MEPLPSSPPPVIRIGSRQSALALIQTAIVQRALEEAWPAPPPPSLSSSDSVGVGDDGIGGERDGASISGGIRQAAYSGGDSAEDSSGGDIGDGGGGDSGDSAKDSIVLSTTSGSSGRYAYEVHAMRTAGDKNQATALPDFGAKSLWTHELEALLLQRRLDLVVHSLKDVPTQLPPDLTIGAVLAREDPRDALVVKATLPYRELAALPAGAVVGTSSVRRAAQLARAHPRLRCANVRGNVGTRLAKLDAPDSPYAALVLAAAGLRRLQLGHRIAQLLDARDGALLHAVGQGALAVEVRAGDARVRELVRPLVHVPTMLACLAERSLMRTLEGGCSVPIGVETEWADDGRREEGVGGEAEGSHDGGGGSGGSGGDSGSGSGGGSGGGAGEGQHVLVMRAIVVSVDGAECAEATVAQRVTSEEQADEFGRVMARRLIDNGAADILRKITLNRAIVDA